MACYIGVNSSFRNQIFLSYSIIKKYKIPVPCTIVVKAGTRQKKVTASFMNTLKGSLIQISRDLVSFFLLPLDIPYDISFQNGELHIGAVIGLLLAREEKDLTEKFLRRCSSYTLNYENTKGLVYVFSRDQIDMDQKTITGYYYQPYVPKEEIPWKKAVFPYPNVIFQRKYISGQIYKHLTSEMGNRIFNYPWFNKWEMAQWLEEDALLAGYLPETRCFHSVQDLDDMLNEYHKVFLKPTHSGSYGKGIMTVCRKRDGDYFRLRNESEKKVFKNKVVLDRVIKAFTGKREYIVQQGISTLTYENRPIVFRVIMQKDGSRQWQCTGIVALLGQVDGLDSHSPEKGIQLSFQETLKKSRYLTPKEINKLQLGMVAICKEGCSIIDRHGHYGDVGVDMVLDQSYKPWLIEINVLRHNHRVPLFINDKKMYCNMKTRILDYAKSLAQSY